MQLVSYFTANNLSDSIFSIAAHVPSFFDSHSNIPWGKWLDFSTSHQLCLFDWPDDTICPGPNWHHKRILTTTMIEQIDKYEQHGSQAIGTFSVQKWNSCRCQLSLIDDFANLNIIAQTALDESDPLYAQIPLVISVNGDILHRVRDGQTYQKLAARSTPDDRMESDFGDEVSTHTLRLIGPSKPPHRNPHIASSNTSNNRAKPRRIAPQPPDPDDDDFFLLSPEARHIKWHNLPQTAPPAQPKPSLVPRNSAPPRIAKPVHDRSEDTMLQPIPTIHQSKRQRVGANHIEHLPRQTSTGPDDHDRHSDSAAWLPQTQRTTTYHHPQRPRPRPRPRPHPHPLAPYSQTTLTHSSNMSHTSQGSSSRPMLGTSRPSRSTFGCDNESHYQPHRAMQRHPVEEEDIDDHSMDYGGYNNHQYEDEFMDYINEWDGW